MTRQLIYNKVISAHLEFLVIRAKFLIKAKFFDFSLALLTKPGQFNIPSNLFGTKIDCKIVDSSGKPGRMASLRKVRSGELEL